MDDNQLPRDDDGENTASDPDTENKIQDTEAGEPDTVAADSTTPGHRRPINISAGLCAVLLLATVLITFMTTYVVLSQKYVKRLNDYILESQGDSDSFISKAEEKLEKLDSVVRSEFLYGEDIDDDALTDSMLKGYMSGLGDKYAEYYTAEEYSQFTDETNGEMQGIGISVVYDDELEALEVISVFPDSPAEKSGMEPGDMITYVGDAEYYYSVASLGYTKAVSMLRGAAGSTADFIACRGDNYSEEIPFSIERGYVTETTVSSWLYSPDESVGVIRITSFDAKTPDQFNAALDSLIADGVTGLILDVRYNPGGELTSVCKVLDVLLPEGTVIRTVDKDGNEEVVYTSDAAETDLPMAVLCNGKTASAGELFTAALSDYRKAAVVGTQTFGKGSMQTIKSFGDGTGVKYTFRYYCPPVSDNYDGVGITPDVVCELSESLADKNFYKISDSEDNQMAAAYKAICESK